jgi:hypothetical protein
MILMPYVPLLRASTWFGRFVRNRRRVTRDKRQVTRKRLPLRPRSCVLGLLVLFLPGCESSIINNQSSVSKPFPRTALTERQWQYQEAKKLDPNLPPHSDLVLR